MGGGGSFLVLPIERTGRVDYNVCKVLNFVYTKVEVDLKPRFFFLNDQNKNYYG